MSIGRHARYYLAFGGLFFLFWFLFKFGGIQDTLLALVSAAIDVSVTMAILVITLEYLLPRLIYRKKWGLFFACFFTLALFGGSLIILCQLRIQGRSLTTYHEDIAHYRHYYYWFWADLVFGSYVMVCFIPATGAAIRLGFHSVRASHKVEQLLKEKALSELELLKHQINPHFLFNALNTIYYKIHRDNGPAREILQQFSHMLRYQLYECDKPLVAIEKELQFIRGYIELQRERLNDNYIVTCEGFDEVDCLELSPFLLMPLVENCFKHVSHHAAEENIITIRCSREGHFFVFVTRNTIADCASSSPGIGLENVRKRLELTYPGRHTFTVQQGPAYYEVLLKLQC